MLSFEIGQRESGFYSERIDIITDRVTQPSSTVLVYRYARKTAAFGGVSPGLRGCRLWRKPPPAVPQIVLNLPQGHEDSKCVLTIEITQRDGGFYSARTDTQADRQNHKHTQDRISIWIYV